MPEEKKKRGGGPKTSEGKGRSSRNSTKHGACAKHFLVLEDESKDEYQRHYDGWLDEFQPQSFIEQELLQQLIWNSWLMKRATRRAMKNEATADVEPANWTAPEEHKLELMQRYKTTAERAFYRSLGALRQLGKDILKDKLTIHKLTVALEKESAEKAALEKKVEELTPAPEAAPEAVRKEKERGEKGKKKHALAVIEQWVDISTNEAGKTVTKRIPSNDELKKEAAKMKREPDLVYRRLFFAGAVPEAYRWTTNDPQALAYGGLGTQRMTWAAWKQQIVNEMLTVSGHLQPCPNMPRPHERGGCECPVCTENHWMLAEAGLE